MFFKPRDSKKAEEGTSLKIGDLFPSSSRNLVESIFRYSGPVGLFKKIKWLNSLRNQEIGGDDTTLISKKLLEEIERGSRYPAYRRALYKASVDLILRYRKYLDEAEIQEFRDAFEYEAFKNPRLKAGKETAEYARFGFFFTSRILDKEGFGNSELFEKGAAFGLRLGKDATIHSAFFLIEQNKNVESAIIALAKHIDDYTEKSKLEIIKFFRSKEESVKKAASALDQPGKKSYINMISALSNVSTKSTLPFVKDLASNPKFKKFRPEVSLILSQCLRSLGDSDLERLTGFDSDDIFHELLLICIDKDQPEEIKARAIRELFEHKKEGLDYILEVAKEEDQNQVVDELVIKFIGEYQLESLNWLRTRGSYLPGEKSGSKHSHLLELFWMAFCPFFDEGDDSTKLSDPKFIRKIIDKVENYSTSPFDTNQ